MGEALCLARPGPGRPHQCHATGDHRSPAQIQERCERLAAARAGRMRRRRDGGRSCRTSGRAGRWAVASLPGVRKRREVTCARQGVPGPSTRPRWWREGLRGWARASSAAPTRTQRPAGAASSAGAQVPGQRSGGLRSRGGELAGADRSARGALDAWRGAARPRGQLSRNLPPRAPQSEHIQKPTTQQGEEKFSLDKLTRMLQSENLGGF